MANAVSHAALPHPIKGARFTLGIPYFAAGDPTDPTTPDTERSIDGAAFADCTEEVTTVSGTATGSGYITLTGDELNASIVQLAAKAASGPKTTLALLYPRVLASVGTGTLSAGSAGGGTLGTLLAYDVTGCIIKTTGGTGGAGGSGSLNNQARKIVTYNTSTGAFTVVPDWETTPDNTTTYAVLLPEGVTLGMLRAINPTTAGRTLDVSAGGEAGVDWANVGSQSTTVGLSGTTVKDATDVNTDTDTLLARLTSARAGYLDNINNANLASVPAFPSNFAALGINASGHVSRVVLVDALTTYTGNTLQTGDSFARIGATGSGLTTLALAANLAIVATYLDMEIASIITTLGAAGAGLTAMPWNAAWDAEVQSEVDEAIIAKGLDHLVFTSVVGADIADNSIIARLASKSATADWDSFSHTTDSLEALSDTGGGAAGSGSIPWTLIIRDGSNNPISGVDVWVTSDSGGSTVIAGTIVTNASGEVSFMLDAGTYFRWAQKPGFDFTNPDDFVVA